MKKIKITARLTGLLVAVGLSLPACGASSGTPTSSASSSSAPAQSPAAAQGEPTNQPAGSAADWTAWQSSTGYLSFQSFCHDVNNLNQDVSGGDWGALGLDGPGAASDAKEAQNETPPPADASDYDAALTNAIAAGGTADGDASTAFSMSDFNNMMPQVDAMNAALQGFTRTLAAQGITSQQTGCLTP